MQRGHNRQVVFANDDDFAYYCENLLHFKKEFGCKIYSYCLMTNHVHLLVDPGGNPESLSLLMKRVAGRQTRYINKLEKRSGSLWEGRYKSSIVSSKEYLLACSRYIELNPVRAGMVENPSQYQWSSYGKKAQGVSDPTVDFDRVYRVLGRNTKERQLAYQEYVEAQGDAVIYFSIALMIFFSSTPYVSDQVGSHRPGSPRDFLFFCRTAYPLKRLSRRSSIFQ